MTSVTSVTCSQTQKIHGYSLYNAGVRFEACLTVLDELTKVWTPHEVIAGIFWVGSIHLSGYGVEPGKVVSMETVVVLQPAESGGADRQVGPVFGLHCLCCYIKNMHIMSCVGKLQSVPLIYMLKFFKV